MVARRSRRGSVQRQGPRRKTVWIDSFFGLTLSDGQMVQENSLLSDLIPTDTQGLTLVRTLIHYYCMAGQVGTGVAAQVVSLAIGLADQEAFAAGVLSDPETEGDEPILGWVWRDRLVAMTPGDTGSQLTELRADIRAMRKIDNGELYFTQRSINSFGTPFTVRMQGIVRCLFKLP